MKLQMKLLVVEDSAKVQRRLQEMVNELSKVEIVGLANNATTALLLAKAHRPETAIVDLHLKDGGGLEVITALKDVAPETNVVVLLAENDIDNRSKALECGADYFFDKGEHLERVQGLMRLLSNIRHKPALS
jgi:DNA-binding NarL/FixJ family response regulator